MPIPSPWSSKNPFHWMSHYPDVAFAVFVFQGCLRHSDFRFFCDVSSTITTFVTGNFTSATPRGRWAAKQVLWLENGLTQCMRGDVRVGVVDGGLFLAGVKSVFVYKGVCTLGDMSRAINHFSPAIPALQHWRPARHGGDRFSLFFLGATRRGALAIFLQSNHNRLRTQRNGPGSACASGLPWGSGLPCAFFVVSTPPLSG